LYNKEFIGIILSWVENVEVVEPQTLRQKIATKIGIINQAYQSKKIMGLLEDSAQLF
jgi:predicted DNA-binding transcriptional regulator YafY